MAKGRRSNEFLDVLVASSAPYYVAKLGAGVLSAKQLKPLGHIFNFATLRIKWWRQHLMREIRTSGLMSGEGKRGGTGRQCSRLSSTLPEKLKKAVTSWHKCFGRKTCAKEGGQPFGYTV